MPSFNQSFVIPGAPPASRCLLYAAALVERCRAILCVRAAERGLPGVDAGQADVRLASATGTLQALRDSSRFPFDQLCDSFSFDQLERDALAFAAAPHLDDAFRRLIGDFQGRGRDYVDPALIVELLCVTPEQAIRDARRFLPDGSLADLGLVEYVPPPLLAHRPSAMEQEIVPTPWLLSLLAGEIGLDPRLRPFADLVRSAPGDFLGTMSEALLDEQATMIDAALAIATPQRPARILIHGTPGVGRTRLCSSFAARRGISSLLAVRAPLLPRAAGEVRRAFEALDRHARTLGSLLVLRDVDRALRGAPERGEGLLAGLAQGRCAVFLTAESSDVAELDDLVSLRVHLRSADASARAAAWRCETERASVAVSEDVIADLSASHPLTRSATARAVDFAAARARAVGAPVEAGDLEVGARSQLNSQLLRYAQRRDTQATLEGLVLLDETLDQVMEFIHAVRARPRVLDGWGFRARMETGRGIGALFDGPPGTGKSFAASVVANELELPLYRIDVSSIVDRYIGETEKNLSRVFEEAHCNDGILLFDEADSLFGSRVAVKDAVDRYANMQVNQLLTLIEEFDGIVILTTNLKKGIDSAFLRRISYKITFLPPGEEERLALWSLYLGEDVPLAPGVDIGALAASYELTGAGVRNAVLRAAYGTSPGEAITHKMLLRAIRLELESSGYLVKST